MRREDDVSQNTQEDRLREVLLVAKVTAQRKKKKRKALRYNSRYIFKIEGYVKTAFLKYAKSRNSTGAKILRNCINSLLRKSG